MKKYVKPAVEVEAFLASTLIAKSGDSDDTASGGSEGWEGGGGNSQGDGTIEDANKKGFGSSSIWD